MYLGCMECQVAIGAMHVGVLVKAVGGALIIRLGLGDGGGVPSSFVKGASVSLSRGSRTCLRGWSIYTRCARGSLSALLLC